MWRSATVRPLAPPSTAAPARSSAAWSPSTAWGCPNRGRSAGGTTANPHGHRLLGHAADGSAKPRQGQRKQGGANNQQGDKLGPHHPEARPPVEDPLG